jgi:hypothetical protein
VGASSASSAAAQQRREVRLWAPPHPLQHQQQQREVRLCEPLPWLSAQWREVPLCEPLPWLSAEGWDYLLQQGVSQTQTQRGVSF